MQAVLPLDVARGIGFVPMTINGRKATFVLDTGAEETIVAADAARRLGLGAEYAYNHSVAGFGGTVRTGEVHPDSVTLGSLAMRGFFTRVAAVNLPALRGEPADGLLGADVLDDHDLDYDLPGRQATLYSPIACDAPRLPWGGAAHGTPAHVSLRRHLVFDVEVEGHRMPAFIDTGAQESFIDAAAAARLGVTDAALRLDPTVTVRGVGSSEAGLRQHRFARLNIAGLVWDGPVLVVAPLRLDDADVVLGADFLDSHRVWLSYRGRRVFVAAPG